MAGCENDQYLNAENSAQKINAYKKFDKNTIRHSGIVKLV